LVLRYYSGVYNFASRLTDDPVEAAVLTHGAFISTRRQLRSRRNEVEIVTILLTAVIRAAGIAKLEELLSVKYRGSSNGVRSAKRFSVGRQRDSRFTLALTEN
jgi:hypothetical protein